MSSWKTTLMGIVAIMGSLIGIADHLINGTPVDLMVHLTAIGGGIGLLFAKDSNVTGGNVSNNLIVPK